MVADQRYKLMYAIGYRPMLFDLQADPNELVDLGDDPAYVDVRKRHYDALVHWSLTGHNAVTMPEARISAYADKNMQFRAGILIGYWDEAEVTAERKRLGLEQM